MSLNSHIQQMSSSITLESLGLATRDDVGTDGVLGQVPEGAPPITVQVDTDGTNEDTTLSQPEIDRIPKLDASIAFVKDNAAKIVDMRSIQKDIEGGDGISSEKSDIIEATFESFYGDNTPRASFSKFESKINFDLAKRFMAGKIKATQEALLTEFNVVKTDALSEFSKDVLRTREFCVHDLTSKIIEAVKKIQAVAQRLGDGKIILPFSGDKFIDMTCSNFLDINIHELDLSVPVSAEFRKSFETLCRLWKESDFITGIAEDFIEKFRLRNPGMETPSTVAGLFPATLVVIFTQDAPEVCYSSIVEVIDQKEAVVKEKIAEIDEEANAGSDLADVVVARADSALEHARDLTDMEKNVHDLACFADAAAEVILGLVSLK